MTEQTELRPLKRSIPPDLQERVEDIQIKVPRTSGIQNIFNVFLLVNRGEMH